MFSSMWIDPPTSNFWSGSVLPIPTLPAVWPGNVDPAIDTYSVVPELTLKKSVTVKIPTWRLSISGKIALVNVAIPVENRFLKVKSVTSKVPVISTSLNVAIPDTLRLSKS